MDRLFVIRHGETDDKGTWPRFNTPLNAKGRDQAQRAGEALLHFTRQHNITVDHIRYSPQPRTTQTAGIVGDFFPLASFTPMEAAKERRFGRLAGQRNKDFLDGTRPYSDLDDFASDGVQRLEDLRLQVRGLWRDLQKVRGNVVLVGHKASLRELDHEIAGRPDDATYRTDLPGGLGNAAVTQLVPRYFEIA